MKFYVGLHQPSDAQHFDLACVSINRLHDRQGPFNVNGWILDSGAFTAITTHGQHRYTTHQYAERIKRWNTCGQLHTAVAQDYMCEPIALQRTGLTIAQHQQLTLDNYIALTVAVPGYVNILPVLQGYHPDQYAHHVTMYADRLTPHAWVGVGSVCKRNTNPGTIVAVLNAIHTVRPDLRLHGFGVKLTALCSPAVRDHLWSADSMAWSYAARKQRRNPNSWREAKRFADRIAALPASSQPSLW